MIANLPGRIVATMAAICVFAVALTATLNFYKYDSTLSDLLRSRFTFLLRDMRNTLETGIDLGLPLRGLDNVPELIGGNAARNPDILSIEVFDPGGTVLFSTDTSFVGDLVAATWLDRWHKSTQPIWSTRERDADTLGITLQNSLGQTAGAIALRYDRSWRTTCSTAWACSWPASASWWWPRPPPWWASAAGSSCGRCAGSC